MADATQFDHDRLGHLLSDRLLRVPRFQRSYSWDKSNVEEYLSDLKSARERDNPYFMGTIVFAEDAEDPERQQIVDGQQRLATTGVLLIAIRDLLREYEKGAQAGHIDEKYIRGYDLLSEEYVARLALNPDDQPVYDCLVEGSAGELASPLSDAYQSCLDHLRILASTASDYRRLVAVTQQLDNNVQVLVAVASDLPEAYVIFETLNDRGADLTTADLLKNYLFSQAKAHFQYVESAWTSISGSFEKSEDLVKFIRHEHASRNGRVTTRKLYRAIQRDIGTGAVNARKYLERLDASRIVYAALREPDHPRWNSLDFDVRDALLAYRRFGFESSLPLLLAAFATWDPRKAARLLSKVANWSVRAQFAGRIGGSVAEEAFGDAAQAVSSGLAKNQDDVKEFVARIIPSDAEFRQAFEGYGNVSVTRAKYLLAMLENVRSAKKDAAAGLPDWSSKAVTIEHIFAKSNKSSADDLGSNVDQIGNLTLLERNLNRDLENKPFEEKGDIYKTSKFGLTQEVADMEVWTPDELRKRTRDLASLACEAWPT